MAKFKVTLQDGSTYMVDNAPEDISEDELKSAVEAQLGSQDTTSELEAGVRGLAQGATLGFADEITGLAGGAADFLQGEGFNYTKNRDESRAAYAKAADDQPMLSMVGELVGGVAVPFGIMGAAAKAPGMAAKVGGALAKTAAPQGASLAQRTINTALNLSTAPLRNLTASSQLARGSGLGARALASAKEGASLGALYGLGSSDEDTLIEQAGDAGYNALIGGGLGAALPPVVDAARGLSRTAMGGVRAAWNPTQQNIEKTVQNIARDAGDMSSPQAITQALQTMDNRMRAPSNAGDPTMTLGDLGGENYKGYLKTAADTPNDASTGFRKFLERRKNKEVPRLEAAMADTVGDADAYATSVGDVIARRKANADADFKVVRAQLHPMTGPLKNVLERPIVRDLVNEVQDIQGLANLPIGYETRMDMLHGLKTELDGAIAGYRKAARLGADPTAGRKLRAYTIAKQDLLNAIDSPEYKTALSKFAGDSAVIDAAETGFEDGLRMPWEELGGTLRGFSTDLERNMFRMGVARSIAHDLEQKGLGHNASLYFRNHDIRRRINAIWPDQASKRRFMKALDRELKKNQLRTRLYGNSDTAKNLKATEDAGETASMSMGAEALDMGRYLATGQISSALRSGAQLGRRFLGMNGDVAQEALSMARRPAAQGLPPELFQAVPALARRSDVNLPDPYLRAARGGLASGLSEEE